MFNPNSDANANPINVLYIFFKYIAVTVYTNVGQNQSN